MTKPASQLIDERIAELGDWRGDTLARLRALIHDADPEVVEDWKWRGVPVWAPETFPVTSGIVQQAAGFPALFE
jgi:hypothetical protein